MSTAAELMARFNWQPQPAAWKLVNDLVAIFLSKNAFAADLASRMKAQTGTRFVDWIDHLMVPDDAIPGGVTTALQASGWVKKNLTYGDGWVNEKGMFPIIGVGEPGKPICEGTTSSWLCAIKAENVIDFMQAHDLSDYHLVNDGLPDNGTASRLRMALGSRDAAGGTELWAIERHGLFGFNYDHSTPETRLKGLHHLNVFRTRKRQFKGDHAAAFAYTDKLVDAAIADLGRDWTCDLFFKAEREFWQKRNRAAQVQYARQQTLGLGWANHDHHTYRSSREAFPGLVKLWEKLGFYCRERFYAGHEASWGAQVMEQPITGITTFNDVDMTPEELMGDFSHEGFKQPMPKLGTVGLWCELHGEAVFEAGMHHLEAQFDHHALVEQLDKAAGVKTMAPFTTFPYLRQAFTEGERWKVESWRIDSLLKRNLITPAQAQLFRAEGALGSHLENLERNDGFKGFNQQGVSDIIARTDARRVAESDARKAPVSA